MKILALETSAKACSAAVSSDGSIIASAFQSTGLTHSRTLMPMVEAMLKNAELTVDGCDAIAVACGPGSFTGIRIGVSTVKGLGWGGDIPCVGVSTLEAMAWAGASQPEGTVICGWQGVTKLRGKACFPLTDEDLFPMGSTKLNGVKFYGNREPEQILSYIENYR